MIPAEWDLISQSNGDLDPIAQYLCYMHCLAADHLAESLARHVFHGDERHSVPLRRCRKRKLILVWFSADAALASCNHTTPMPLHRVYRRCCSAAVSARSRAPFIRPIPRIIHARGPAGPEGAFIVVWRFLP